MEQKNIIFLVDINSFFVTCELIRNPQYKKKSLVIAHKSKRSVITAASYEAKKKGIDSAMPLKNAVRIDPQLVIISPDFDYYRECSQNIMRFLKSMTKKLEIGSIDEAYLDVTDYFIHKKPTPENILKLAKSLQFQLLKKLGFPANIGISHTKFLAKMASELKKPFIINTIFPDEIKEKLWPLPIETMYGIGKKSATILKYLNIQTIDDFVHFENNYLLQDLLGKHILEHQAKAQGIDPKDEVAEARVRKSISKSETFLQDIEISHEIEAVLLKQWKEIANLLEKKAWKFRSIRVFYRQSDFHLIQRSYTFNDYQYATEAIYQKVMQFFYSIWEEEPIRLVGLGVSEFIDKNLHLEQLDLFELSNRQERTEKILSAKKKATHEFLKTVLSEETLKSIHTANELGEDSYGSKV